jgi:hypothetical protein
MASTSEPTVAEQPATETHEYIEYLGETDSKHGVAFLQSHTIPKGDPVWERLRVDKPSKDLVWERDPLGPAMGFKGNRMLLSTDGMDRALVTALTEKVPGYKLVNE